MCKHLVPTKNQTLQILVFRFEWLVSVNKSPTYTSFTVYAYMSYKQNYKHVVTCRDTTCLYKQIRFQQVNANMLKWFFATLTCLYKHLTETRWNSVGRRYVCTNKFTKHVFILLVGACSLQTLFVCTNKFINLLLRVGAALEMDSGSHGTKKMTKF